MKYRIKKYTLKISGTYWYVIQIKSLFRWITIKNKTNFDKTFNSKEEAKEYIHRIDTVIMEEVYEKRKK